MEADEDHLPTVIWGERALRRYRDRLFVTEANPPVLLEPLEWDVRPARLWNWANLSAGCVGRRRAVDWTLPRLPTVLTVRRREGGEALKPHARARTQSVQHLCQSLGILPWRRDALPLIYAGDTLIAVGDLWQDANWCVAAAAPGWSCVWEDGPELI